MRTLLSTREAQNLLNINGWPVGEADGVVGPKTRAGTLRFQRAYALEPLPATGELSPPTLIALSHAPAVSTHFDAIEMRSKGDGTCFVSNEILWAGEQLRQYLAAPLSVISAWRDVAHNRRVGGARTSLHTYGRKRKLRRGYQLGGYAFDISRSYGLQLEEVKSLRLFSGIGYLAISKRVTHIDVRHVVNRGGSPKNPRTWRYRE